MSKQQTNAKGRVIPTREAVETDLRAMPTAKAGTPYGDLEVIEIPLKDLVKYVMTEKNSDYYRGIHLGIAMGQRELMIMEASNLDFLICWKDDKEMDVWKQLEDRRDFLQNEAAKATEQ